ncbi:MAG: hypothetical protein ACTHK4_10870 [Mycobacteriales bacterium]
MTPFDYLLNIVLISLVVLQLRGRRLDRRGLVLPLVLVGWAASQYLRGIPTVGNDGWLVALGVIAGLSFGTSAAKLTRLDVDRDGVVVARATLGAAALWIVGIGMRMGFALFVQYGGKATVARFSATHHITGQGWVTALVLMSLVEVVSRTLILWTRSRSLTMAGHPAAIAG